MPKELFTNDSLLINGGYYVNSRWCLGQIIHLCSNDITRIKGYQILSHFLECFYQDHGKLRIMIIGYRTSFPDIDEFLKSEAETGTYHFPIPESMGCMTPGYARSVISFINNYEY